MPAANLSDEPTEQPEHSEVVSEGRDNWQRLQDEFPGDHRLSSPVLYAIPLQLLATLRTYVPDLLTDGDLEFETRLRQLGGTGFQKGHSFCSGTIEGRYLETNEFGADRPDGIRSLDRDHWDQRVYETLMLDGYTPNRSEYWHRHRIALEQRAAQRLKGYLGWLVTDARFFCELNCIRHKYEQTISQFSGVFFGAPDHIQSGSNLQSPEMDCPEWPEFESDLRYFLPRWSLSRLITWEIVEPLMPSYLEDASFPHLAMSSTGISLHLPWPMLVDNNLTLRELGLFLTQRAGLDHLQEWLNGQDSKWGFIRYAKLLDLYLYYWLGLQRRYSKQLHRKTALVDRAFAAFWMTSEKDSGKLDKLDAQVETARKTRQKLQQRLKRAEAAWAQREFHTELRKLGCCDAATSHS